MSLFSLPPNSNPNPNNPTLPLAGKSLTFTKITLLRDLEVWNYTNKKCEYFNLLSNMIPQ